ncbi:ankyrin repeat domain-containing protein 26-like isoform X2 [Anolis carolinensis]|uniref:ankyrin repeat domain-containing protein 26-like isoform X2 n=1 Tax=Anolis carolinensis TaxID=28377 RepID=UPI002F2B2A13
MLVEQLKLDNKDSVSILKLQNIFRQYERLIECEKRRYIHIFEKVKKLENEKKEQEQILEEMRNMKSVLNQQQLKWESDISNLKLSLKQEKEKRMIAEILYEKIHGQSRKKEEQYCKQMEEKQQLELMLRSSEMELKTLKDHLKQLENERKKVKKIVELKHSVDIRLDQEMKRNNELQKECLGTRKFLKIAKNKLKEYDNRERSSKCNFHSDIDIEVEKLKTKVDELSHNLEFESKRCTQLESRNHELHEHLSSMKILHKNYEKLEKSNQQLEEQVAYLKHHIQTQAASQETLEQIQATNYSSLKNQLENRFRDLESELTKLKNNQQDNELQKHKLERYKELYSEELKMRKYLKSKLDRCKNDFC